jgi:hypothetical protein
MMTEVMTYDREIGDKRDIRCSPGGADMRLNEHPVLMFWLEF